MVNMTDQEREMYNISLDSYRTNLSVMKNERAEGRAEGREEKAIKVARSMKKDGMSIDTIMRYTGLTLEDIASL